LLLAPLVDASSPWHPMAREVEAYADYRAGATAQALKEFRNIANDHDSPAALRQRSDAMATFLAAGGDKDYGVVPPPTPQIASGSSPSPQNPSGSAGGSKQP